MIEQGYLFLPAAFQGNDQAGNEGPKAFLMCRKRLEISSFCYFGRTSPMAFSGVI